MTQTLKRPTNIYHTGAVLSVLSALTTAILMYGPNADTSGDFDTIQMLHSNGLYLYKKWVLFFHPQFAFLAAAAASFTLFRRSPGLASAALFYLGIWAITEMSQQAYLIDALNQMWRPAYLAAESADKAQWKTMILAMNGISDTLYFVLIFGFGLGSFLFGLAFPRENNFDKWLGISITLIGGMSLLAFGYYYANASFAGPIVNFWYDWIYGPLQIGVRLALGGWLWRTANNT
ncbi:MAG: hypothetical protein HWE25_02460 [Alphaproteobacteria bacterium]|nr:hypothetical protein [Alphaproteobacteria bacterium]